MNRNATLFLLASLAVMAWADTSVARLDMPEETACRAVPEDLGLAAASGDAEAQAMLGAVLIEGLCGATDDAMREGMAWLARASAQGHADAAALLGDLLMAGHASDRAEALVQYRRAAEGGHVAAQHRLGILLVAAGDGDAREEGLYWLGAASSGGDGLAAVAVGLLHARGLHGVPHDACLAAAWYEAGRLIGAPVPIAELEAELGPDTTHLCNGRAPSPGP
jgi:TPR repeat protein